MSIPDRDEDDDHPQDCPCPGCWQPAMNAAIVHYMMWFMEPTDRALRPALPPD